MRDRRDGGGPGNAHAWAWVWVLTLATVVAAVPPAGAGGGAGVIVTEADRDFWSFRKPARPPVPRTEGATSVRTPVDAFILAKLRATGRDLAPEAEPRVLVRRASLDLTGLPPTPGEVDAFVADRSPGAFERLVDRLLASPHFGERWGRHWLDVVGYTDTVGFDVDADLIIMSEGKWRYRDYVIRSINEDKPHDRFLTEQLAGDELVEW